MKLKQYRRLLIGALLALIAVLGIVPGLVSAQGATYGTNWFAQYFNDPAFTTAVSNQNYPNGLNFNFGANQPTDANGVVIAVVPADNFSARYTSAQTFAAGTFQFNLNVDDRATVFIGGTQVFQATVPGNYSFAVNLAAGTYAMQVDFVELSSVAYLQFYWQLSGTGVPTTPGAPTATPGPTGPVGNVQSVTGLSLRSGPYLGASLIGVLRPDTAYTVTGRNNDEGGSYTWYRVVAGERTGWASGRYLNITGDVNTLPFIPTIFEQIDGAPDVGVLAVPRAIMNLRRRPSARSARLAQVPWGAEVQLVGRTIQGGLNFWYQVRYNGMIGWIYAPFVSVRGNLDSVPIR